MKKLLIASCLSLVTATAVYAQSHEGHMAATTENLSDSSKAYMDANNKMHSNMTIKFSGDADIDFVKGMIPHHQGAIDMAKVVLKYGKDPEIKKLAEGIISAQEQEIKEMNDWLEKHDKK